MKRLISNKMNNFYALLILIILGLSILFIFALPFKSQPDYQHLILSFHFHSISQYTPLNFIGSLELPLLECSKDRIGVGSDLKFRSEGTCFNENMINFIKRLKFFLVSFFTGLIFCFTMSFLISKIINKKIVHYYWLVPMMFPMVLWNLTFYSLESLFLIISIYSIYLVHQFKFYPIWILLLPILFFLDRGNFVVLVIYITFYLFFLSILKYLKFNISILIAFIGIILIVLFLKNIVFFLLNESKLLHFEKMVDVVNYLIDFQNRNDTNYNIIALVAYTFISFIFYTPDHHWPYTILIFILANIMLFVTKTIKFNFKKIKRQLFIHKKQIFSYLAPVIFTPLTIVTFLPTHAYGKYYLFCYVAIFSVLRLFLSVTHIIMILCLLSFLISLEFIIRLFYISI